MEYLQIHFTNITETQSEILIAQLNEIGFDGFEEENNELKACIPFDNFNEELFTSLVDIKNVNYAKSIIKKENWNAIWEAEFTPIEVNYPNTDNPFAYLRAYFHAAKPKYKYDLIVTPKMSFGTGHHATTFLMVQQMSQINFAGKTVIDFGTGTGVLAILAQKMGAKKSLAIDCDDWSIENTEENITANGCSNIDTLKAFTIPEGNQADIILANINLNIISENILQIRSACLQHATLLFSGIMLHDEENIVGILKSEKFIINSIHKKDNWLCILANY
jgi:ribosomal protein L11 methyltransferase